ncbi:hypothetical protein K443DRAFT_677837 [Laccaria amethystina LaAM-08-1]|uniref:Uncharacterized protein n=1 Tax=Laccaria amethystina LaAM-08-1 TaxID=1095629 RepID=A0A0C9XX09_9AGAR|nr:hypothetical protein K443DRAFT_677837 [Laccaria amethystina LaAM-08-1]
MLTSQTSYLNLGYGLYEVGVPAVLIYQLFCVSEIPGFVASPLKHEQKIQFSKYIDVGHLHAKPMSQSSTSLDVRGDFGGPRPPRV